MAASVKAIAVLTAKAGCEDELKALLHGMVQPSRAEPGNLQYELWRDAEHPGRYVLEESYRDSDAVIEHRASDHYKAYLSRIGGMADRSVIVLAPEDVVNNQVQSGRPGR
ncbi:putative quinol monooxygenase [Dyella telluris]|uniref:Antibiotic biosynthesis monooxygenase n=1 Tax=Dyella telluris TaxID=2763498 RepID=A0A7G8Q3J8_9GAMM|nr:putative quinol monooxygenase [Dyella telluris]QNK01356.1 antibiotic biosynthesis monooxygenase [Dyella telluris]